MLELFLQLGPERLAAADAASAPRPSRPLAWRSFESLPGVAPESAPEASASFDGSGLLSDLGSTTDTLGLGQLTSISSVSDPLATSPVGAALIGLAENDTASWVTRDGQEREMTVLEILYQPEAAGRFAELARDAAREPDSKRDSEWLPAETRRVIPLNLAAKIAP